MSCDAGEVVITTRLGAVYTFPDVVKDHLSIMLPYGAVSVPEGLELLGLANLTGSFLSIPMRVVSSVRYRGEPWWKAPDQA